MRRFLRIAVVAGLLLSAGPLAHAQFVDASTGLMQMPTAEMNPSGTFMITNNFLNSHITPDKWDYHTFGYGVSIAFFSRIEITYSMVIIDGKRSAVQTPRSQIMFNQDRHFAGKILLLKEGELWKWTPSIAVGISDPVSATPQGYQSAAERGSGYFHRLFAVATKHFDTSVGGVSVHVGYQYNPPAAKLYHYNGPCAAVDWTPVWLNSRAFSLKAIAEYDARTFNLGFIASVWDGRFDFMFDLSSLRWISFGGRFKMRLR